MTKWRFSRKKTTSQPCLPGVSCPSSRHRLSTPGEQALALAQNRLLVVFILFAVSWVAIGSRLAYLTLSGNGPETPLASAATKAEKSRRADITDRNGTLLATSLPTTSVCIDSRAVIDPEDAAKKLLSVLPDLNSDKVKESLYGNKHCAIIRRHLTPRQDYSVNRLGIAGLNFLPDERRIYPAGNLTAHIVGYSDIDNKGLAGIERSMSARLDENQEPLALSIDLRVQSVLRRELASAVKEYRAEAATGLVMDIATGELLGIVSLPDFNPSHAGSATDAERFNRATLGVYEMGSTFKIFNTALALDSGSIRLTDVFDTLNPLEIGRYKIRDFERETRNLNVAEIFTHSSNLGSARMAQQLGGAKQRAFFSRLGLTEKIPLEIGEIGSPLFPQTRNWNEVTTMTASFGHGIAVNAVQLAAAVATIVNNGHPVRPTLIKRPADYEQDVDMVVSPHTSALIRGLMRLVVTRGTATRADVEGYLVGGKTGTADKLGAKRKYANDERLSSFIGLFPINAPRFLVFALLDNPKGTAKTRGYATAGWVAAPMVNNVVAQIGPILGIAPLPKDLNETAERQVLKPLGTEVLKEIMTRERKNYAAVE